MILTDSTLLINFKDDNSSRATNEIVVPLHAVGTTESFHKIMRGGQYRSRQIEIVIVSMYDTVFVGMDEDLEVCDT